MSVDAFYRDVAQVALAVAEKHGFVLGGGVAWLVNGLVERPTEDIDLFTDTDGGVAAAAGKVSAALIAAGYQVDREEADELFEGMSADIQEFIVTARGETVVAPAETVTAADADGKTGVAAPGETVVAPGKTGVTASGESTTAPDETFVTPGKTGVAAPGETVTATGEMVVAAPGETGHRLTRGGGAGRGADIGGETGAGRVPDVGRAGEARALRLTLCRLDRRRAPVVMDLGPVMHLDDLVATKVAALVNRREVRDYIDVAAALERYSLARVLELAHAADPGLDPGDIAEAGRYLDRLDDARFAVYGVDPAPIRDRLRVWPR